MYLKYNEKSLFDSVKTRNTDIFSYTSFYKNNSNDSYKDQYSECFLDFKNNYIYYIWKKNNLIYRPKGPAIIKLDAKTGFPLEIHFRQNLNVSSFEFLRHNFFLFSSLAALNNIKLLIYPTSLGIVTIIF